MKTQKNQVFSLLKVDLFRIISPIPQNCSGWAATNCYFACCQIRCPQLYLWKQGGPSSEIYDISIRTLIQNKFSKNYITDANLLTSSIQKYIENKPILFISIECDDASFVDIRDTNKHLSLFSEVFTF